MTTLFEEMESRYFISLAKRFPLFKRWMLDNQAGIRLVFESIK